MTKVPSHGFARARAAAWALVVATLSPAGPSGCVDDPDCGICDPHNLVLESLGGVNYANRKVYLLGPPCEGAACRGPVGRGSVFLDAIGPCEETPEAQSSSRPDEYCKLSPLVTQGGIEFIFNNLLDPESVELVRRRPDNSNLFEVWYWKTRILHLEGPITRYRGDYEVGAGEAPDLVSRLVNLSCIDHLRERGVAVDAATLADPLTNPCNAVDPESGLPHKLDPDGVVWASQGRWDTRAVGEAAGHVCDNQEDGVDTCCNQCDFVLGTGVAKYGLVAPAPRGDRSPRSEVESRLARPGVGAISCDPDTDDKYRACAAFEPWVDRSDETATYHYAECADSTCAPEDHPLPLYDWLRQTHPDERPAGFERKNVRCRSTVECTDPDGLGLPGTECIGTSPDGRACDPAMTPDCEDPVCRPEWFVACEVRPDTTGPQGYCVDRRFSGDGAPACFRATRPFDVCDPESGRCQTAPANNKLAVCDVNGDGRYDAVECCGLGGGQQCEPSHQPDLEAVPRYERSRHLPDPARTCICPRAGAPMAPGCEAYASVCEGRAGEYAIKFVTRRGGVIYDPAIKGVEWQPADRGAIPRATAERCAEDRHAIGARNREDGWRAHDDLDTAVENDEDYDRALCSGQRYRVVFSAPPGPDDPPTEYVRDKLGNTLAGRQIYTFETPEFHVVPGSAFPSENLRIGACDELSLRFTNKYDLSPENLEKVMITRLVESGVEPSRADPDACLIVHELDDEPGPDLLERVAGGPGCVHERDPVDAPGCHPPCLTIDVGEHEIGGLAVRIDPAAFGRVLETGETYFMIVPGLASRAEMTDPSAYGAAFWDACGMPLVLGGYADAPDTLASFTIDPPKCREDADGDDVQVSCDNASDVANPDQGDLDRDGVGDVVDLCPTVPSGTSNAADSDSDGVGNACDRCRQPASRYNARAAELGVPGPLLVRNVPMQSDADHDGIGDACDNCVVVANCEDFGPDRPYVVGEGLADENTAVCQRDDDGDMIGDACMGTRVEGAAGPVGFDDGDDFDQDGITNAHDLCPRQPVDRLTCVTDEDCPAFRPCTDGACNHVDQDRDTVGDVCDTCPADDNGMQVLEMGMQEDDQDGDFIGDDCEAGPACATRKDPRPFSFYEVSALGRCCVTALAETEAGLVNRLTGDPLVDPEGVPVRIDCEEDADGDGAADGRCRKLPVWVAFEPGVVRLPLGCEEALAAAGRTPASNRRIGEDDVDGDMAALWEHMCFLPQRDQDFDGLADRCDLCPHAYDPENLQYVDTNQRLWSEAGKYCNGDYAIDARGCDDEGESEGSSSSSGGSGSSSGSGP